MTYRAVVRGDLETLRHLIASDAVWHIGGDNPLSGDYRGHEEIFEYWRRATDETGGGLEIEVRDVMASDAHAAVLSFNRGARGEEADASRRYEGRELALFRIDDARIVEAWFYQDDMEGWDEFWS